MNLDSCFKLGKITKAHGLKGDVQIILEKEFPLEYSELESVFVEINKKLIPFFIEKLAQPAAKKLFIKFEDVDDINDTSKIHNSEIYLPLSLLPVPDENIIDYKDLIGYTIQDKTLGTLGIITDVFTLPGQDVLSMDYKNKEILIPCSDDSIQSVDIKKKIIHTEIPDGLLEIYM